MNILNAKTKTIHTDKFNSVFLSLEHETLTFILEEWEQGVSSIGLS